MPRFVVTLAALTLTGMAAACGGNAPENQSQQQTPAAAASDASHEGHTGDARRVFFVEPQDGATVKSPVKLVFGSEQYTIAAVPPGEVTEVRPDMGHFHLGVDTDCLAAGTTIPKADPWIHFGDGKNTIDMSLAPGQHKLAVQVGDDLHRTVEGLCQTITVNVAAE